MAKKEAYKSRVYTERPAYADFDPPHKFQAINSIIQRRLVEHPNAICSYSGGSDSDIMIDAIERARNGLNLPPIKYVFFNTGLEMKATKDHVKTTAEKYGVEIEEHRPEVNIVMATRKYGVPFSSKIFSSRLDELQYRNIPISIYYEFNTAFDKQKKRKELAERYPSMSSSINFICGCNSRGESCSNGQFRMDSMMYFPDFYLENPPDFKISAKCCDCCKKRLANKIQKNYDMVITGERRCEGGIRQIGRSIQSCFSEMRNGQFRLKPLYWVTDADKLWYKDHYDIRYSDAYEVYGLTRTGCCGCPISYKAVEDLEKIRPYEPNVVKAAWNIFGKSYEYRAQYNRYKTARMLAEGKGRKTKGGALLGQIGFEDLQGDAG